MRQVEVFYSRDLKIQSIVEITDRPDAPPAGVFPVEGCESMTIELSPGQQDLSLIELHTRCRIELGDHPRLVSIDEDRPPKKDDRAATRRLEVTVHAAADHVSLDDIADFDLDRVPDPGGELRLLVTAEEVADLVERGFEVRITHAHRVRPLDPGLVIADDEATAWLEDRVRGIERNEGP